MSTYYVDGEPIPLEIVEPEKHTDKCVGIAMTGMSTSCAIAYLTAEQAKSVVTIFLNFIAKKEQAEKQCNE